MESSNGVARGDAIKGDSVDATDRRATAAIPDTSLYIFPKERFEAAMSGAISLQQYASELSEHVAKQRAIRLAIASEIQLDEA